VKAKPVIAVTGLKTGDNPQPGVPVIRSLRDAGYSGTMVGLAYEALEAGAYVSDLVDHVYQMPYPSEGGAVLLQRLRKIHERHGLDVLIPTLDSEIQPYIRLQKELQDMGIHTFLPEEEILKLRDKIRLERFARENGIAVPRSMILTSVQEAWSVNRTMQLPVMIKGQLYEAYRADTPEECAAHFSHIRDRWGLPVLAQEFLAGEEYNVVGLGDGEGEVLGLVPTRKLVITDKGKGFSGVTLDAPQLMEFSRKVVRALRWRGPLELEIKRDAATGEFNLLEINPRFPAWVYLATGAGQNLPQALVQLALGERPAPLPPYRVGTIFIRHSEDLITHMETLGRLTAEGELHWKGSPTNSSKSEE
jgi:carbamoyl-phosphate synthase large subunit